MGISTSADKEESVRGVKEEVKNFCKARYKESSLVHPLMESCAFNQIYVEEVNHFEKDFTMEKN